MLLTAVQGRLAIAVKSSMSYTGHTSLIKRWRDGWCKVPKSEREHTTLVVLKRQGGQSKMHHSKTRTPGHRRTRVPKPGSVADLYLDLGVQGEVGMATVP